MSTQIGSVEFKVNNELVAYLPETPTMKLGRGDTVTRTLATGGGGVTTVTGTNLDTKKGKYTVSLATDDNVFRRIDDWSSKVGKNVLSWSDTLTGKSGVMQRASITTDPDIGMGSSGETEVEFEGLPWVVAN